VVRVPRHGGAPTTALTGLPFWADLALDDAHVYALADAGPVAGAK